MGKKKRPVIHAVNLSLPQSRDKSIDQLYRLLRNRVRHKSNVDRSAQGKRAELLIIEFAHKAVDIPTGVLVKRNSFIRIVDDDTKEAGFMAEVDSVLGTGILYVFKTGRAYVEED
ncbi:MAG: hypothetical protein WA194_02655 [Patescibacteria group bacterium]